jgi:hypothetical protein
MADAVVDIQATNLHALGANFKTSSSGTTIETTNVTVMDEVGNVVCEENIEDITNYTQDAGYCGVDFMGDFVDTSAAPVPFLENIGCTFDSKLVTGITVSMTAGEPCTISISSHNHDNNEHDGGATPTGATRADALALGIYDGSDFMPHGAAKAFEDWNGRGVPDFGVVTGTDSSPISATVTFSINHVDQVGEAGKHLVGKSITPRCELSMEFSGTPTSNTKTLLNVDWAANTNDMLGCITDTIDENDSNDGFDSFALTAHAHPLLATV